MSNLQLLTAQVLLSHTLAGSLCEAVFRTPGFRFYCVYALAEFICFAMWPMAKTWITQGTPGLKVLLTPKNKSWTHMSRYLVCALVMTLCHTSGLKASQYLDYTTVIIFKSAKVPGVVLCRAIMDRRAAGLREAILSLLMMLGLVLFGMAEQNAKHGKGFSTWGLMCISISLCCGCLCANLQQKILQPEGTSSETPSPIATQQLLIFQYSAASVMIVVLASITGELSDAFTWYSDSGYWPWVLTLLGGVAPTYGTEAVYRITETANATHANAVCSARKVVTFVLSYLLYSKPANGLHLAGATLTIGAGAMMQYTHATHKRSSAPKMPHSNTKTA